jgi:tetratricopeptide (TPR) repeat protein
MGKKSLILSLALFIFVFSNYYYSQNLNKTFYDIVYSPNETNIEGFLSKIKFSKYYKGQLGYFSKLNPKIAKDIIQNNLKKTIELEKTKELLKKNPSSRDINVKIAILYFELNNFKEAQNYYKKAKQIDPEILIQELED